MELIPVLIIRLLVPFTIRKWPFWGGVASLAVDAIDLHILNLFGWQSGNGIAYQSLDKMLDTYYLAFEWVVVREVVKDMRLRGILTGLFIWRALLVAIFEITQVRVLLFFAPNIFEYLYLLVMGLRKYAKTFRLNTAHRIGTALLAIGIPKLFLEYLHHVRELPLGLGYIWQYLLNLF